MYFVVSVTLQLCASLVLFLLVSEEIREATLQVKLRSHVMSSG